METTWKEQWLKNYKGEGDTAELETFVKNLDFGAKKGANYLPWAVVERIFRLQDGSVELVRQTEDSIVETDKVHVRNEIDDNGVITEIFTNSYFINIKATWQGQEYTERYPLQDASGKPLSYWTQNDLNKSMQRGKVKAIAIVSGIGYKLFEDGDLQFETDEDKQKNQSVKTEDNAKKLNEKAKPEPKQEPKKVEKKEEPKPEPKKEVKPEPKPEPKEEPKQEPIQDDVQEEQDNAMDITDRVELENQIKQIFLNGGKEKATIIRNFLKDNETTKIQELTDDKAKELYRMIA